MRIEQLHCFLETAQTQSIHVAAENLYISQPAVSRSIRALENELGVSLFKRTVEGAFLTKEGEILYPEIKDIIAKISDLQAHAHALVFENDRIDENVRMNVLTFSTLVDTLFSLAIGMLQEQYPYVQPILKNLKLSSFSERIHLEDRPEIDLVVVTDINGILSPVFIADSWTKEVLFYEDYVAVLDESHSLSKDKEISLVDAFEYPVIVPQNGLPVRELFQALLKTDETPSIFMQSNNTATVFPMLRQKEGILLTTSNLAQRDFLNLSRVKIIPIKQIKGECFVLYDPGYRYLPIVKDLINYLKYSSLRP